MRRASCCARWRPASPSTRYVRRPGRRCASRATFARWSSRDAPSSADDERERLDVRRLWHHVEATDPPERIAAPGEPAEIACQRCRIARNVEDMPCSQRYDRLAGLERQARAGRVDDHRIDPAELSLPGDRDGVLRAGRNDLDVRTTGAARVCSRAIHCRDRALDTEDTRNGI